MTKRLLIAVFAVGLMAPLPGTAAAIVAAQERTSPAPTPPPPPPAPPAVPARPPAPPDAPPAPPQAPPSPRPGTQVTANVQLDVAITDTISGKPETKRSTLLIRPGRGGSIRTHGAARISSDHTAGTQPVHLALDANVTWMGADLIEATVTFQYHAAAPAQDSAGSHPAVPLVPLEVRETLNVMLRSGRPLLVSRSADPVTNRTVTVELTATIREP